MTTSEAERLKNRMEARSADMEKRKLEHFWSTQEEPKPTRRVIQISAVGASKHQCSTLTALCDDGSIWMLGKALDWAEVPPIPQP